MRQDKDGASTRHDAGRIPRSHKMTLAAAASALCVVVLLGVFAAAYSVMAANQRTLHDLDQQIAAESEKAARLRVELYESRSPARIRVLAHGALGMVPSGSVLDIEMPPEAIPALRDADRTPSVSEWVSHRPLIATGAYSYAAR